MKLENPHGSCTAPCTPPLFGNLLDSRTFWIKHLSAMVTFAGQHTLHLLGQAPRMVCSELLQHVRSSSGTPASTSFVILFLPVSWVLCNKIPIKYRNPSSGWRRGVRLSTLPYTPGEMLPKERPGTANLASSSSGFLCPFICSCLAAGETCSTLTRGHSSNQLAICRKSLHNSDIFPPRQ